MGVINLPRRDPPGDGASEAAVRLRELADEIEVCGGVKGVMVIIDSSTSEADSFRAVHTGILSKSRERALWAVSRIKFWIVSQSI